uniref:phage distal tail protein n=1 Tax=Gracilibacillus lacisalsi TaxID=393087 RepID=UPI000477E16E
FVGKYQDRPSPSRLRINSVEVFALQTVTEDQTPNIAQPGDIITFDHTNNGQVYINGEVYEDNMLGVDYFTLKKGENQLVVLPSDSLNISGRYRERYS